MRDRRNHASPNSAQTEAAAAGALEVQLAGDASFGKLYKKPTIGDPIRPVEYEDIRRMNRLMYAGVILALALVAAVAALAGVWQYQMIDESLLEKKLPCYSQGANQSSKEGTVCQN